MRRREGSPPALSFLLQSSTMVQSKTRCVYKLSPGTFPLTCFDQHFVFALKKREADAGKTYSDTCFFNIINDSVRPLPLNFL